MDFGFAILDFVVFFMAVVFKVNKHTGYINFSTR